MRGRISSPLPTHGCQLQIEGHISAVDAMAGGWCGDSHSLELGRVVELGSADQIIRLLRDCPRAGLAAASEAVESGGRRGEIGQPGKPLVWWQK